MQPPLRHSLQKCPTSLYVSNQAAMLLNAHNSGSLEAKRSSGRAIGVIQITEHVSLGGYVENSSSVKP